MALPAGVTRLGSFKGLKGDTGTLAFAEAVSVAADQAASVEMIGPVSNRGARFGIPRGLPGLNAVPTDEAVGVMVTADDTNTGLAVAAKAEAVARVTANYANDATAGNLRGLISKLERGVADVHLLWVTDSLGNEPTEPPYMNALWLASQYPAYSVNIAFWDEVGGASYKTPLSLQTGTGARTLTVWVAAKSGGTPSYMLGSRYAAGVAALTPDAVIILHGHNTGGPPENQPDGQRNWFLSLTESVTATHPVAGLVMIAENPSMIVGRETWQAHKAQIIEQVCGIRGYGFIDAERAFWEYGNWQADLMGDVTHPNPAGSALIASLVNAAMSSAKGAMASRLETSLVLRQGKNYLVNGDFSAWSGTNPDGWFPVTAAVAMSKDTTNYETGMQAAKLSATATAGPAYIQQDLSAAVVRELAGQVVTLAVRYRQPAANTGSVRFASNVTQVDGGAEARDGYMWSFLTWRIPAGAPSVYVRAFARLAGADLVDISIDRMFLVKGILPLAGG